MPYLFVFWKASTAAEPARLPYPLCWRERPYQGSRAYNDSKLANLLFTSELQRRLTASGSRLRAIAAHPGFVSTNMYARAEPQRLSLWSLLVGVAAQDPDAGALPILYAAVADLPGDSFTGPEHLMHMRGGAQLIKRSRTPRTRNSRGAFGLSPRNSPAFAGLCRPGTDRRDADRHLHALRDHWRCARRSYGPPTG